MGLILMIVLELSCFAGCGSPKKIAITPENYKAYFNIKFNVIPRLMSILEMKLRFYTVTATCRSTVTASFSNVELTGKVHLPVDQKSHRNAICVQGCSPLSGQKM